MATTRINTEKEIKQGKVPHGASRSSHWSTVRKNFIKKHSFCAVCNGTKKLNVHHIKPFHLHPELELDPSNLITLCENNKRGLNCHLLIGHLGNFKNINPKSVEDAKIWNGKLKELHFQK